MTPSFPSRLLQVLLGSLVVLSWSNLLARGAEEDILALEKNATKAEVEAFFKSDTFWNTVFETKPALIHSDGFSLEEGLTPAEVFAQEELVYEGDASKVKAFKAYNQGFYAQGTVQNLQSGDVGSGKDVASALHEGYTVVFQQCHRWSAGTRKIARWLGNLFGRRTSVNCYIAAPSLKVGMDAHNDQHDFVIVQLSGLKRWMLWTDKSKMLPLGEVHESYGTRPDAKLKMGEPEIEVVLRPGDLLYVPRGTIHLTSTDVGECAGEGEDNSATEKLEKSASLHMTVAIALDAFALPWIMGAATVSRIPQHQFFMLSYQQAVKQLNARSLQLRRSVALHRNWKEKVRQAMHLAVDEMIDKTDFLGKVEESLSYFLELGRKQAG